MKKALITGISGFVGAGLARHLLLQGTEVHGLVRTSSNLWRLTKIESQLKLHDCDLRDSTAVHSAVKAAQPEVIFHLATHGAYTKQKDEALIVGTAVHGTLNLLTAAKVNQVSMVVNVGSSSEYGTKDHPMKESERIDPNSFYAIGKAAQTHLAQYFATYEDVPTITFRLFSVYGPYEEPGRLVPVVIGNVLTDKAVHLADPYIARDFIYLEDVCRTLTASVQRMDLAGEIFNLGTGIQHTLGDLADVILSQCGSTKPYEVGGYDKRSFDTHTWVADMEKAREIFNYSPQYTLDEGIKETINWYREHAHYYQ